MLHQLLDAITDLLWFLPTQPARPLKSHRRVALRVCGLALLVLVVAIVAIVAYSWEN